MVLAELGAGDIFVAAEVVVGIVEGGEHLEELESALLRCLQAADHIRVALRHKVVLDFVHLEHAVSVSVEFVESFVNESLAERVQLTAKCSQKFVEANLTVP